MTFGLVLRDRDDAISGRGFDLDRLGRRFPGEARRLT